jgi:tetratricopeptide (TPR) repeat protein
LNNYEEAIQYYNEAIAIRPNAVYFVNLGDIYKRQKNYDDAIQKYEAALFIDDHYERARASLADIYEQMYRLDPNKIYLIERAIQNYESASKLSPSDSIYLSRLGDMYVLKKEYDKAIEYYKKATLIDPNDTISISNLATCYDHKKQFDLARKYYDLAKVSNPDYLQALEYSEEYYKKMKNKKALEKILKEKADYYEKMKNKNNVS